MSVITYQVRLPDHLRDSFLSSCKANGLTGSSVLKQFMLDYISKNPVQENSDALTTVPVSKKPVFDYDFLMNELKKGNFYYYDNDLVKHSLNSSDSYFELLNYGGLSWDQIDLNELNYNISIGEPDRPRIRQFFSPINDPEDTKSTSSNPPQKPSGFKRNKSKKRKK